jgi:hypothetical protein
MRAAILVLLLVTTAPACGGEPTCDQIIDHVIALSKDAPPDRAKAVGECTKMNLSGDAKRCMIKATSVQAMGACMVSGAGGDSVDKYNDYMNKSKRTEAKINTQRLVRTIQEYQAENGSFPPASAGPTPPVGTCCKQPKGKCMPDPSQWTGPAWTALRFSMDDPHYYSYWYEVKDPAREVIVHAIGDLDCDGLTSDLAVHLTPEGRTETSTNEDE